MDLLKVRCLASEMRTGDLDLGLASYHGIVIAADAVTTGDADANSLMEPMTSGCITVTQ